MTEILLRRGTTAAWAAANPTLAAGEPGVITDAPNAGMMKIGDGATTWANLSYVALGVNAARNGVPSSGAADAGAPLQTLLAASPSSGVTVIFPPGTYRLDTQIALTGVNNVRLVFMKGAKLKPNFGTYSTLDAAFHFKLTDCHGWQIVDFDMDSSGFTDGTSTQIGINMFKMNGACYDFEWVRGYAEKCAKFAAFAACQGNVRTRDLHLHDCMSVSGGTFHVQFDSSTVADVNSVDLDIHASGPLTNTAGGAPTAYYSLARRFVRPVWVGGTSAGLYVDNVRLNIRAENVYGVADLSQNPAPANGSAVVIAFVQYANHMTVRGHARSCAANNPYNAGSGKTGGETIGWTSVRDVNINMDMIGVDSGMANDTPGGTNKNMHISGTIVDINTLPGNYWESAILGGSGGAGTTMGSGDATCTVEDTTATTALPAVPFRIIVENETMIVTAASAPSGGAITLTTTRGADSTSAASHAVGIGTRWFAFARGNPMEIGGTDPNERAHVKIDAQCTGFDLVQLSNIGGVLDLRGASFRGLRYSVNLYGIDEVYMTAQQLHEMSQFTANVRNAGYYAPVQIKDTSGTGGRIARQVVVEGELPHVPGIGSVHEIWDISASSPGAPTAVAIKGGGAYLPAAWLPPGTAPPSGVVGSWTVGERVSVRDSAAAGYTNYVCTASGSFDTVSGVTATCPAGQGRLVLSPASCVQPGGSVYTHQWITISGTQYQIDHIDYRQGLAWLDRNVAGALTAAAVTTTAPSFTKGPVAPTSLSTAQRLGAIPKSGAVAETFSRDSMHGVSNSVLTSGTLYLASGRSAVLPAGVAVNNITFVSSGAATAPTHQWFCLVRVSDLAVLAKTVDDTSTAWGASSAKTLAISGGYTPSVDTPVYFGICVTVTTTMPGLYVVIPVGAVVLGLAPKVAGTSTASLTDPASLGGTAGAITAVAFIPYAYAS